MSESAPSYADALADLMALADDTSVGTDALASPSPAWSGEESLPDTQSATEIAGEEEEVAELYFGSVDEFVREIIVPIYRRKVSPRGSRRWSAEWWRSAEAISRLEALWRSWEHLRLDGATGISTWWRDHADYHMDALFDPDGPFGTSQDENKAGDPLPYAPPPPGLFVDVRND